MKGRLNRETSRVFRSACVLAGCGRVLVGVVCLRGCGRVLVASWSCACGVAGVCLPGCGLLRADYGRFSYFGGRKLQE